jgi:phage shock protein C
MNTNTVNPEALRRPVQDRVVAGVAAGLARYLGVDVMIIRLALVVLTVAGGAGIPLYLAGLLLIPGRRQRPVHRQLAHRVPAIPVAVTGARADECAAPESSHRTRRNALRPSEGTS